MAFDWRKPTVTPVAGLSLTVTRPETLPRGVFVGALVTDWAFRETGMHDNAKKTTAKN
jgi:hypothetical protein